MRYAITNQTTDRIASFDGFQPWNREEWLNLTGGRYSDEQLNALALYVYRLNRHPIQITFGTVAARGQKIYLRQKAA